MAWRKDKERFVNTKYHLQSIHSFPEDVWQSFAFLGSKVFSVNVCLAWSWYKWLQKHNTLFTLIISDHFHSLYLHHWWETKPSRTLLLWRCLQREERIWPLNHIARVLIFRHLLWLTSIFLLKKASFHFFFSNPVQFDPEKKCTLLQLQKSL